jgi:hypothetical protein
LSARSQSRRVSQETSQKRQKASELRRERPADAEMDGDRQRAAAPVAARLPADPPDVAPAGFAFRRRVHGSCPTCAAIAIARNPLPAPTMRSIPGKNSVMSAFCLLPPPEAPRTWAAPRCALRHAAGLGCFRRRRGTSASLLSAGRQRTRDARPGPGRWCPLNIPHFLFRNSARSWSPIARSSGSTDGRRRALRRCQGATRFARLMMRTSLPSQNDQQALDPLWL